jgi:hypothetical protein
MSSRLNGSVTGAAMAGLVLAVLAFLLCLPSPVWAQGPTPFANFHGSWTGNGTITLSSGATERIRCRVKYVIENADRNMQQELRCASDSYKFEVSSNIDYSAGSVYGTWAELTRKVNGALTGTASGNQIEARVAGGPFTALVSLTTTGNAQAVTIRPTGTDVTVVSISLQRGR